jgi:hypothetical protein
VKFPTISASFLCIIPGIFLSCLSPSRAAAQLPRERPDEEIVAALTGGQVIIHVSHDKIIFVAVNQPIEQGAPPPRFAALDSRHIGIFLGASEWRMPADPKPVRLDRELLSFGAPSARYSDYTGSGEEDLETMGAAYLEKLHSLAERLHHKLNFPPDQALLELVVIGFGPKDYGPEVWTLEYRITQENITANDLDYWQTRVLRPRFTQLYPPEKHAPHTIVETGYPGPAKGPSIQELIEGNDPRIAQLSSSDPRFAKVDNLIAKGDAQKAETTDSIDFLRALVPLLFPHQTFFMGTMEEEHGFDWVVPPQEPVEKALEKKNGQQEAPSLRRRPDSP